MSAEPFYVAAGAILGVMALRILWDPVRRTLRRDAASLVGAAFWAGLGLVFAAGSYLPAEGTGLLVIALVVLATTGKVRPPLGDEGQVKSARPRIATDRSAGNRLLVPVLAIPLVALTITYVVPSFTVSGNALFEARHLPQIALGTAALVALGLGLLLTRETPLTALDEGSRLLRSVGWAIVLPQLLGALGGIFARAGLGQTIADLVSEVLPTHHALVAVVAYTGGMAIFTVIMGNAFAAFPVLTLGLGIPLIVQRHGGDPAIMASLGMLSGYCGTLLTPMAANFNLVPTFLLGLADRHAVIKAQVPVALSLWCFNTVAMAVLVYWW